MLILDSFKGDASRRQSLSPIRRLMHWVWYRIFVNAWDEIKALAWWVCIKLGAKEASYHFAWTIWKHLQMLVRAKLSPFLAILLVILVLIREVLEYAGLIPHSETFTLWDLFVVVITLGTIGAAVWEVKGNKLSASPQERGFVIGMRNLMIALEKFKVAIKQLDRDARQDHLAAFTDKFIDVAGRTICGKKAIDVGVLIYQEPKAETEEEAKAKATLTLYKSNAEAHFPPDFDMPLKGLREEEQGPAFRVFESGFIAHMPNKNTSFGFLFKELDGEDYKFRGYIEGWYPVEAQYEEYTSVLTVPVSEYVDEDHRHYFGVLSFTTSSRDPFVHRDYIMALCLSDLLSQAIAAVKHTPLK